MRHSDIETKIVSGEKMTSSVTVGRDVWLVFPCSYHTVRRDRLTVITRIHMIHSRRVTISSACGGRSCSLAPGSGYVAAGGGGSYLCVPLLEGNPGRAFSAAGP